MLIRIEPTDRFGMVIDTDATSFAALTFVPGRIVIGWISTTAFVNATSVVGTVLLVDVVVDVASVVVEATVVGAIVDGATVVVVVVVDVVVVVVVVVGTTLRVVISVPIATSLCVPIPNCPKSFFPQQRTCPVDITAHAWLAPATTSTTVPVRPVTTPGVSRAEPLEPDPN